ncbi:MAG: type III-B CRISPR module RAMP protein Cmr6 [Acidobacteriota bacterium]
MADLAAPGSVRRLFLDPENKIENLALRLYTLAPREFKKGDEERAGKRAGYQAMAQRCGAPESALPAEEKSLAEELINRQERLIEQAGARGFGPWKMKLSANLTCGLSTPTIFENGMTLLRPYGIPLLPSSSIKGVLEAWLAELLKGKFHLSEKEQTAVLKRYGMLEILGSEDAPGRVIFLDALPFPLHLETDLTTVHYQKWYSEGLAPGGWESPIPVYFITFGKGTVLHFGFIQSRSIDWAPIRDELQPVASILSDWDIKRLDSPADFLKDLLDSAGRYKGFGSQTAQGYGRMEPCA